jgi:hypothetical protein
METWIYTKISPNMTAKSAKWIFKTKRDKNGQILKRKARMVVQGFE